MQNNSEGKEIKGFWIKYEEQAVNCGNAYHFIQTSDAITICNAHQPFLYGLIICLMLSDQRKGTTDEWGRGRKDSTTRQKPDEKVT